MIKTHNAKALKGNNIKNVNNSNKKLNGLIYIKKTIPKKNMTDINHRKPMHCRLIHNMSGLNMCVSTYPRTVVQPHKIKSLCQFLAFTCVKLRNLLKKNLQSPNYNTLKTIGCASLFCLFMKTE